jgi:uncharacterized protein (DUF1778 family)
MRPLDAYGDSPYSVLVGDDGPDKEIAMAKEARVDVRMSPEHKALLEQAAAATEQTLSSFMVSTLLREAHEVLERETTTKLSLRDMKRFYQLITSKKRPNRALREAAKRYKARYDY